MHRDYRGLTEVPIIYWMPYPHPKPFLTSTGVRWNKTIVKKASVAPFWHLTDSALASLPATRDSGLLGNNIGLYRDNGTENGSYYFGFTGFRT